MDPGLDPSAVWAALSLVGLAELGDKSQLACLVLATRFRPREVLAGAALAFGALNAMAVAVGALAALWIPRTAVEVVAGLLFIGIDALRGGDDDDDDDDVAVGSGRPVFAVAAVLAASELGDKTQLAVAGLAAGGEALSTWLGATVALVGTSALGVIAARLLRGVLPVRRMRQLAGVALIALGAAWLGLVAWRLVG